MAGPLGLLSSLAHLGALDLDGRVRQRLGKYLELLQKWNRRIDLTAPMESDLLLTNHLFEALWAAKGFLGGVRRVADLASGAGLPGLGLQIYSPDLEMTLVEPRQKRVVFLKEASRQLKLPARVFGGRGEDFDGWEDIEVVAIRAWKPPAELLRHLARKGCLLLWFHSRGALVAEPYRILLTRQVPGTQRRLVSLMGPWG